MRLYCNNCSKKHKIYTKLWRNAIKQAYCCNCRQYIKFFSFDELQEYEKEINPNKKKSNDRILGPPAGLLYGFF